MNQFGNLLRRLGFCSLILCGAFLVAVSMTGCTKRNKGVEAVLPDGSKVKVAIAETLRISIKSEPPTLDWNLMSDTSSSLIADNIMEGLVQYNLADKELGLVPALATKWESSDEARRWKITLREGVKWSDGVVFTAQHVLDGWKRLLAKETASNYSYFLFGIKNAKAFSSGKVPFEDVGVKITAPHEITVELEAPMSYFPHLLTHQSTFPIRLDVVQKFGDKWTEPGNIVTLGPFRLMSWQHDRQIVLERNESYYAEKPAIKYISMQMIQEQSTAINLFDSGNLDAIYKLPSVELRKLRTRPEFRETGTLALYYYGINSMKPPMNNPLVRQAIAMAIDRQELVQMLAGGQMPMTSWVPAGMFGYEPERGLSFNPEKARELLKKAGYADPSKLPKLEIKFNTDEDHQRVAENVQAQLKRNLGIDVELRNEEWKVYLNSLKTDPPHLFRFGWLADYPDPDNFLSVLTSYSENNHTRWKNAKFDELVLKAAGSNDREVRRKIYDEAQKLLVEEELPVVPLFSSVDNFLISPRVENYPVNLMAKFVFKGVKLK